MTVYELIRELSKHDPNLKVVVNMGKNELGNSKDVGVVRRTVGQRYTDGSWYDCSDGLDFDTDDGWSEPTQIVNLSS